MWSISYYFILVVYQCVLLSSWPHLLLWMILSQMYFINQSSIPFIYWSKVPKLFSMLKVAYNWNMFLLSPTLTNKKKDYVSVSVVILFVLFLSKPVSIGVSWSSLSPLDAAHCLSGRTSCCSRRSRSPWISCTAHPAAASPVAPSLCFPWPGRQGNTGVGGWIEKSSEMTKQRKKTLRGP